MTMVGVLLERLPAKLFDPQTVPSLQVEDGGGSVLDPLLGVVVKEHVHLVDSVFLQKNVNTVILGFGLRASGESENISSGDGRDNTL